MKQITEHLFNITCIKVDRTDEILIKNIVVLQKFK